MENIISSRSRIITHRRAELLLINLMMRSLRFYIFSSHADRSRDIIALLFVTSYCCHNQNEIDSMNQINYKAPAKIAFINFVTDSFCMCMSRLSSSSFFGFPMEENVFVTHDQI